VGVNWDNLTPASVVSQGNSGKCVVFDSKGQGV